MSSLVIPCPNCGKDLKLPDETYLGRFGRCPRCQHRFLLEERADAEVEFLDTPHVSRDASGEGSTQRAAVADAGSLPVDSGTGRLRELRRRAAGRRRNAFLLLLAMALLATGGLLAYQSNALKPQPVPESTVTETPSAESPSNTESDGQKIRPQSQQGDSPPAQTSDAASRPIELQYLPGGADVVLHVRAGHLWRADASREELRACLGPLTDWAEKKLRQTCRFEPAEIEEALIGLYFTAPGDPPRVATVVRLVEEYQQAEFLERFPSQRAHGGDLPVYTDDINAFAFPDTQTIAIAPQDWADDIVNAAAKSPLIGKGIEELLGQTDRNRDFTVIFRPDEIPRHQAALFGPSVVTLVTQCLEWFGEDVDALAWSFHLGKRFSSELFVRHETTSNQRQLKTVTFQKTLDDKMASLAEDVLAFVESVHPYEFGKRKIIGRFPAMLQAVSLGTHSTAARRTVRLSTRLPERAGPNLAIAARFVSEEQARVRSAPASVEKQPAAAKPQRVPIVDRLKKPMEVDFRRAPLQDAFESIGKSINVKFAINGDALKLSGYTKNMPQTFELGTVPATLALHEILKEYDEMVIVIDDANDRVLVTTKPVAAEAGLEPFSLQP